MQQLSTQYHTRAGRVTHFHDDGLTTTNPKCFSKTRWPQMGSLVETGDLVSDRPRQRRPGRDPDEPGQQPPPQRRQALFSVDRSQRVHSTLVLDLRTTTSFGVVKRPSAKRPDGAGEEPGDHGLRRPEDLAVAVTLVPEQ